jgi:hypothetical protein
MPYGCLLATADSELWYQVSAFPLTVVDCAANACAACRCSGQAAYVSLLLTVLPQFAF